MLVMTNLDLAAVHEFALQLAREAGEMILHASVSRASSSKGFTTADAAKKNRVDLVTETDQKVEQFVRAEIRRQFSTHQFIGEESYAGGEIAELTDEPTWIIDPIDGTTSKHFLKVPL